MKVEVFNEYTPPHGDEVFESDLIRRSDALDAIEDTDWYSINSKGEMVHGASDRDEAWYKAGEIHKAIEDVPSVEPKNDMIQSGMMLVDIPEKGTVHLVGQNKVEAVVLHPDDYVEPKKGEWILQTNPRLETYGWYKCSECGAVTATDSDNFCHNCGADMRKEQSDEAD